MLGINDNIGQLLKVAMNSWNTLLTVNRQILGLVRIQRGIVQGDSLRPLLYVAALIPLTIIFRQTQLGSNLKEYRQNKPSSLYELSETVWKVNS